MTPHRLVFLCAVLSLFSGCGGQLIGTPCRTSEDCGGSGGAICEFRLPGGQCTRTCRSNLDCGPDSLCIGPFDAALCRAKCDAPGSQSSCRAGYLCTASAGDVGGFCEADRGATGAGGGGGMSPSAGGGGGGMAPSIGGGGGASAPSSGPSFLFPELRAVRLQTELVSDAQGVLHLILQEKTGKGAIHYARCASECGQPTRWSRARLGDGQSPQLAVSQDGTVHVAWSAATPQFPNVLRYAQCTSGCASAAQWSVSDLAHSNVSLRTEGQRALQVGPRGLVLAFFSNGALAVGRCPSGCLAAAAWTLTALELGAGEGEVSVALTNAGAPRVAVTLYGAPGRLSWWTCDTGCESASAWTHSELFQGNGTGLSLALDPQDRPRMVFSGGVAASVYPWFAACDTQCHLPASWSRMKVGPVSSGYSPDLRLVNGAPLLLLDGYEGAVFLECTSGCAGTSPTFEEASLETEKMLGAQVAPTPLDGCIEPQWKVGSSAKLALHPAGTRMSLLYDASSWSSCGTAFTEASRTLRVLDVAL